MLRNLEIQNYALIDHLNISFVDQLNIITGETGAGKSIILGAMGLVMGNRADSKVLYNQDKKCFVEASYFIKKLNLKEFFKQNDLDYDDELIIRREINTSGKSRAFVNDSPVRLDTLKELSTYLISIHQQFDTQDIQSTSKQLEIVDAIGDTEGLLSNYQSIFMTYQDAQQELQELTKRQQDANKELDYLSFQLDELDEANFVDENQEELESTLQVAEHSSDIKSTFEEVVYLLEENEPSIIDQLGLISSAMTKVESINQNYQSFSDRLTSVIEEIKDLAIEANNLQSNVELDEEQVVSLRERLDLLYKLLRKHNLDSVEELVKFHEELAEKVKSFRTIDDAIENQKRQVEELLNKLQEVGKLLTNARRKNIVPFQVEVHKVLTQLAMPNAKLEVQVLPSSPSISGMDQISFMFSANKGGKLQSLKEVASGGETSRLALTIKSILADKSNIPILVFDEIDSGVSGEVATKMGYILKDLAKTHQVITITHSPMIAARANQHLFVYKYDTEERTVTAMKELQKEEIITELAKMMGGEPVTDIALKAAKELLNG